MPNLDEILRAKQDRIDQLHRCQPGRTALLVIDMQRGFLEPGAALEVPPGRAIVPNVRRLVDVCRAKGVPAELVVKPGAGHGWLTLPLDMSTIADWFDKYLKKPDK